MLDLLLGFLENSARTKFKKVLISFTKLLKACTPVPPMQ
jgi:hypothetical protein